MAVAGATTNNLWEMIVPCVVCGEDFIASAQGIGIVCDNGHSTCRECLQGWVQKEAGLERVTERGGTVNCPWRGDVGPGTVATCNATWSLMDDLFELLEHTTEHVLLNAALRALFISRDEAASLRREVAAAGKLRAAPQAIEVQGREERIASLLSGFDIAFPPGSGEGGCLYCPRCRFPFVDYDGCAALRCGGCGAKFCALCSLLFDKGRTLHLHFVPPISAHAGTGRGYHVSTEEFFAFHRAKRAASMRAAVASLVAESTEVRAGLLHALLKGAAAGAGVDVKDPLAIVVEMKRCGSDVATVEWGCAALYNIAAATDEAQSRPLLLLVALLRSWLRCVRTPQVHLLPNAAVLLWVTLRLVLRRRCKLS